MDSSMFDGLTDAMWLGFVLLCIFIPFGMWKLIEIIIWIFNHISIGLI